jgi:hypothetical protein
MTTGTAIMRGIWALSAGCAAALVTLAAASAAPPATIEAGKLHVALNGDMPMTGLEDASPSAPTASSWC